MVRTRPSPPWRQQQPHMQRAVCCLCLISCLVSDVCELQSLVVLSFAAGRCFVLLNTDWLLQLRWRPAEEELQTTSCCRIQLSDDSRQTAADHCIYRETLFILSTSGLICILSKLSVHQNWSSMAKLFLHSDLQLCTTSRMAVSWPPSTSCLT